LSPREIDALVADTRIVRNRRKIEATVSNAATMVDLSADYGSIRKYLRSHGGFDATVADLKKRFKFLGDMGAYYFLYVVGEEVPPHDRGMAKTATSRRPRAGARSRS
jgi:DNA-3-methyladenine glycosylase I